MVIGLCITIVTLNVNGLNVPTKRHKLAEWIEKQELYICCLQETYFRPRDTYRLKVRGWKKIFHGNENQKKAGVAIIILNKTDFKIKNCCKRPRKIIKKRKWGLNLSFLPHCCQVHRVQKNKKIHLYGDCEDGKSALSAAI